MRSQAGLNELLATEVSRLGYEYVGCDLIPAKRTRLCVYIDKPQGLTLDDCQLVSKRLSAILDVENPIAHEYSLEVSSPGLDRPLFNLEHFQQFKGKKAHLKLYMPLNAQRNFTGFIEDVQDGMVFLKVEEAVIAIELSNIVKANLVPIF